MEQTGCISHLWLTGPAAVGEEQGPGHPMGYQHSPSISNPGALWFPLRGPAVHPFLALADASSPLPERLQPHAGMPCRASGGPSAWASSVSVSGGPGFPQVWTGAQLPPCACCWQCFWLVFSYFLLLLWCPIYSESTCEHVCVSVHGISVYLDSNWGTFLAPKPTHWHKTETSKHGYQK